MAVLLLSLNEDDVDDHDEKGKHGENDNYILLVSSGEGAHAVDRGVPDTDGQSRIRSGGIVSWLKRGWQAKGQMGPFW